MSSREWCAGVGWDFRFHYRESADRPKWPLFLKASKTTTSTSTVQVQCTVRSNGRAAQGSLHTSSSISTKYSTSMIWILASLYVPFILIIPWFKKAPLQVQVLPVLYRYCTYELPTRARPSKSRPMRALSWLWRKVRRSYSIHTYKENYQYTGSCEVELRVLPGVEEVTSSTLEKFEFLLVL